jgi:hypothetical protein
MAGKLLMSVCVCECQARLRGVILAPCHTSGHGCPLCVLAPQHCQWMAALPAQSAYEICVCVCVCVCVCACARVNASTCARACASCNRRRASLVCGVPAAAVGKSVACVQVCARVSRHGEALLASACMAHRLCVARTTASHAQCAYERSGSSACDHVSVPVGGRGQRQRSPGVWPLRLAAAGGGCCCCSRRV